MVAARDAEYFPPVGMARIWSRMTALNLPGAIWAFDSPKTQPSRTMMAKNFLKVWEDR
jgi:hypothetical protein